MAHGASRRVGFGTVGLYLLGRRSAIEAIAASRGALFVGLLFVMAAGLAREYDGQSLLDEPWHLLLPLGVSVPLALIVYSMHRLRISALRDQQTLGFWGGYRSFLTLFWMTAPLAMLYAVPYERMLSAAGAVRANLWTLALVSTWRVVLISRVASVLSRRRILPALGITLLVADVAALLAVMVVSAPVIQFMGGVRLSEADELLAKIKVQAAVISFFGISVILPATIISACTFVSWRPLASAAAPPRVSRALWLAAVIAIVAWIPLLPKTQPPVRLAHRVEGLFAEGRIDQGLALLAAQRPEDLPAHWAPPPRVGYPNEPVRLLDVIDRLNVAAHPQWLVALYAGKLEAEYLWRGSFAHREVPRAEWLRAMNALDRLPQGPDLRQRHADDLKEAERDYAMYSDGPATTQASTQPAVAAEATRPVPTTSAAADSH